MIRLLKSLFARRRPIVVTTYHVKRTNLQKLKDQRHAQLARELNRPWGVR